MLSFVCDLLLTLLFVVREQSQNAQFSFETCHLKFRLFILICRTVLC